MASNKSSPSRSHSRIKRFLICLVLMSLPLLFFVLSEKQKRVTKMLEVDPKPRPRPAWFDVIAKGIINNKKKIKVGLVNIDARVDGSIFEQLDTLDSQVETISIDFDHVDKNLKWEDIFPEWIDENGKWGQPKCPNLPMPALQNYGDLNVVVAKVPCGIRDVFRLQVNLVVANLAVESGWVTKMESDHRKVHVVFVGSCGPMVEIFRCDDLLMHRPEYWVYRPDLRRLKHQTLMPLGSCQIAPGYAETGKEAWRIDVALTRVPKLAYVTVLHSSEAYVCGAIALAQSILGTQTIGHGMHELPDDVYAVHYLGLKPWMCYRDYDCNWDMQDRHVFASDSAHRRWWQVYDAMPKELQAYCGLTEKMNERIVKWRRIARNASFSDGHWKIKVQDPRRGNYYSD
ncbi:hypothetical protein JHK82_054512 [Glycine max]|nr:hypothetical protein JHK82_054512 [Glycine max]